MTAKHNSGFSMITTLFLMGVISTLMTMLIYSGSQRNFSSRRLINKIKATAYAEAGFEHALAELSNDWEKRHNASSVLPNTATLQSVRIAEGGTSSTAEAAYGEGSFNLALTPISNRYCLVQSTGICGKQEVEVEVLIEDFMADSGSSTPGSNPDNSAWENTIFSAGTMDIGGSGDIDGALHANSTLKLNGNVHIEPNDVHMSSSTKISINGNVQSEGSYTAPDIHVVGSKDSGAVYYNEPVPTTDFPELDLTSLYNTALANGQVINGNIRSNTDINWSNVPGGVVWVNGYMKINANANLACTVVATGYINIAGDANWNLGYSGFNHIISRDSSIKVAGNAEVNGVLYAPGDITLSGTARLVGSVVSGSDVDVNGNVEVINYNPAAVADILPLEKTPKDTLVGIAAWQK